MIITLEALVEGSLLLFDKPAYWTSFDLVKKLRSTICRNAGVKKLKVGHAGTLDPLATGLMIICTGKMTRSIQNYMDLDKEYLAEIKLGATTPSFDLESEIDREYPTDHITSEMVYNCVASFVGEQTQVPPAYSAKYIDGVRAYQLARSGEIVEPAKAAIAIHNIEVLTYNELNKKLTVRVLCGKGTYIRSLARDIGAALGSGAHLTGLRRTKIGEFDVADAFELEFFEKYLKHLKQTGDIDV